MISVNVLQFNWFPDSLDSFSSFVDQFDSSRDRVSEHHEMADQTDGTERWKRRQELFVQASSYNAWCTIRN